MFSTSEHLYFYGIQNTFLMYVNLETKIEWKLVNSLCKCITNITELFHLNVFNIYWSHWMNSYDSNKTKSDLFQETCPTQLHCISDTLHIVKKKKMNTLSGQVKKLKKGQISPGACASMYSLEDECRHTVAHLPSKLESGCRQLLYKLKSCKATQRKCAG